MLVSSFYSASNIFLIVILLAPPPSPLSLRIGTLGDTFPALFQLKRFFTYSDLLVQNTLDAITLQNRCVIRWKLLLNGFRSVLVNATGDKSLRLKIRFVSRDLVLSDRATCTIASRVNFFD